MSPSQTTQLTAPLYNQGAASFATAQESNDRMSTASGFVANVPNTSSLNGRTAITSYFAASLLCVNACTRFGSFIVHVKRLRKKKRLLPLPKDPRAYVNCLNRRPAAFSVVVSSSLSSTRCGGGTCASLMTAFKLIEKRFCVF